MNISNGVLKVFKLCRSRCLNSFNKQMIANALDKKYWLMFFEGQVIWVNKKFSITLVNNLCFSIP